MQMNFGLTLSQTQKLVMTPELRQAITILQLSTLELGQYIENQLLENPLLDVSDDIFKNDEPAPKEAEEKESDSIDWEEYFQDGASSGPVRAEQQMSSQQQLQSTLNQASTNLIDSGRLETLFNSAQQLQQAAQLGISNLQINMEKYKQMIEQMEKDCHQQQVATDMQVVQALQQAISSMAQAQNSLLQSQAVDQMFDTVTKCQDNLSQIEQMGQTTTTM